MEARDQLTSKRILIAVSREWARGDRTAAHRVMIEHAIERLYAPVVHIGGGPCDVAQGRHAKTSHIPRLSSHRMNTCVRSRIVSVTAHIVEPRIVKTDLVRTSTTVLHVVLKIQSGMAT